MKNPLKKSFLLLVLSVYTTNFLSQEIKNCEGVVITNDSISSFYSYYTSLCRDSLRKFYRGRKFDKHALYIDKAKRIGEKYFCDSNLIWVYGFEVQSNTIRGLDASIHFEKYFSFIKGVPGNNSLKSKLMLAISYYYQRVYDFDNMMIYLNKSDSIEYNYKTDYVRMIRSTDFHEYEDGIFYSKRLEKNSIENNDHHNLSNAYMGRANILSMLDNRTEAIFYFKKQLSELKLTNKPLTPAYTSIGYQYGQLKELDSAFFYLNKGLEEAKKANELSTLCDVQSMIGSIYLEYTEQYSVAKDYFQQSLKTSRSISKHDRTFKNLCYLGSCSIKMGDSDLAWKYCEEAYDMTFIKKIHKGNLLELMRDIQLEKRNFKLANKYAMELIEVKDSLNTKEFDKVNNQLLKEKDERLSEELAQSERENQQKEKTNSYLSTIVLVSIGALLFLIGLFIYLIRNYKLKRRIASAQKQVIQETIKTNISELEEKESTVNNLKLKLNATNIQLKELESTKGDSQQNKLSDILGKGLNTSESRNQFISEFKRQYPLFCSQVLQQTGSRITNTDLQLIALIKLNLSSNEISSLLNITLSGVKKAKSRLRKKMPLSENNSLDSYIKSI